MTGFETAQIYIIEDNREFGLYLEDLLLEAGVGRVHVIGDGLVALKSCFTGQPDLIVLDLELPSMRGEELLRIVRSTPTERRVPIVICSDMPDAQRRELELLRIGADAYVAKPFDEKNFLDTVLHLLNASLRRAEAAQAAAEDTLDIPRTAAGTILVDPTEVGTIDLARGTAPRLDSPPPVFSGYRLLGIVGGGAMGTVYRAEQVALERIVALKVLLRDANDDSSAAERFQHEARIMARLNHPRIITVYDVGSTGFTFYIAMEFVEGESLHQRVASGDLHLAEMRSILLQACEATEYLHHRGIIHGDIKPANILIERESSNVKLGDFGISRAKVAQRAAGSPDPTKWVMGTPSYMAPELFLGSHASEQSDQFALARTAQAVLTGRQALRGVSSSPPPDPKDDPLLPPRVRPVLQRATSYRPEDRYPTVGDLRDAIAEAL